MSSTPESSSAGALKNSRGQGVKECGGYETTILDEFSVLSGKYAWKIDVSRFNTHQGSAVYGIIKFSNDLVITTELDERFADDKWEQPPSSEMAFEFSVDQQTPSNDNTKYSVMDENVTPNFTNDKTIGKRIVNEATIEAGEDRYSVKRNLKKVYDVDEYEAFSSSNLKAKTDCPEDQSGKFKLISPKLEKSIDHFFGFHIKQLWFFLYIVGLLCFDSLNTVCQKSSRDRRLFRKHYLDKKKMNNMSVCSKNASPYTDEFIKLTQVTTSTTGCRVTHGIPLTRNQPSTILNPKGKENIVTYSNVPSSYAISPSTDSSGQSKGKEKLCIDNDVQHTNRIQQNNGTTRKSIRVQQNERQNKRILSSNSTPLQYFTNGFKNKILLTSSGTSEIHDRPSSKRRLNPVGLDIPVFSTDLLNSADGDEIKGISKGCSQDDDSPQQNFEFDKGYLDWEAKSFMKTTLQRQDEIYQTLLDISSNSKLEPETEIEDVQGDLDKDVPNMSADDMRTPAMQSIQSIQSEPRRRKSKRQRFPSRYYVTPFRPLENTPRIEKQKNKNSIADSELEELCERSYYWIWSTLLPHYAIDSEAWRLLLGKQAGGWIEDEWLLENGSEAYNSYRPPPFVRVVPTFVPQQSGLLGDCGVWVCIFLDRRIKGEPIFQEQEDTAISAMNFRLKLARLILETKFKEEEKRNNDRGD
ncbi:hypothetical protein QVD17_08690 [Tagetes erecta]|uniref:Ubiquitin-like protease family profile domain-containing protein n=1 Tax=Tagetes erecta TaxID=13708 RepID=A0AAD8L2M4_TARER|nr:hypothetical protein QVD17_08690 [Tagetes erecta]